MHRPPSFKRDARDGGATPVPRAARPATWPRALALPPFAAGGGNVTLPPPTDEARCAAVPPPPLVHQPPPARQVQAAAAAAAAATAAADEAPLLATPALVAATQLLDEFTLGEALGEGTFGRVRVATHKATGRRYAVKQVELTRRGQARTDTIHNELRAWQAVQDSQHVARLYGAFSDGRSVYMLTQLCEGGDLQGLLDARTSLREGEAAAVMRGVLGALAACHARGLAYGDVKPSNFMLPRMWPAIGHLADPTQPTGPLTVVAIDFGCSQYCAEGCRVEGLSGTPVYLAPEVFASAHYSLAVDVWAAGVMMYQLLTGRLPVWPDVDMNGFGRLSPRRVYDDLRSFQAVDFDHPTCAALSPDARDLLRGLLATDPYQRISAGDAQAHPWLQQQQ